VAVKRDRASRRDNGSRENSVAISEYQLGAQPKVAAEGEPVNTNVTGMQLKIHPNVGAFFLEIRTVIKKVGTCP
jgi:hypothetical protein